MTKTLTTDELRQIVDSHEKGYGMSVPINYGYLAARELLANREAQPVGFISAKHGPVLYGEHVGLPAGTHFYTAPPAPAVPDFGSLTKLIVGRIIDCGAAGDDSIADAETFVYNACRAAMLAAAPEGGNG